MLDISANADLEVKLQDIRDPCKKETLTQATSQLYHSFTASQSHFVAERQPEKSHELQNLFYCKLLEEETEGVHLYLPLKDGPPPAMFNLKGKKTVTKNVSDDNVSITPSIAFAQEEQVLSAFAKPADTLSIGSSVSGNVTGAVSHSASGMNLFDPSLEADDDEQAIYEDIDEICENLRKEAAMETTEGASEEVVKEASKKSSILSFLKKKTKGKTVKDKQSSDPYVEVDFEKNASPKPELIPAHSHSSSESYDEMGPAHGKAGYVSDNYEDFEFDNNAPPNNAANDSVPPVTAPETPARKKMLAKSATPLKAAAGPLPDASATLPKSKDDLALFKEKKSKLSLKKSGTLPRKIKLGGGDKKAPPISEISEFPPDARIPDISLSEQVWSLTNQVGRLKVQVKDLSSAVEALKAQNLTLQSHEMSDGPLPGNGSAQQEVNVDANLRTLKEMNLEQVKINSS